MNIFSLVSLLGIFILLYVVFSTGKGGNYKPDPRDVPLIDDIDTYLKKSEAFFSDIKANTEKKIFWFSEDKAQTAFSVVYLHGFSAARQEVSPLSENIAKKLGANIFFTRLTGHGRSNDAMADITVEAFLADAVEALAIGKQIGKKVIVIGTSTGGTLATWLSAYDKSEALAAIILISPNFGLADPKSKWLLKPAAKIWLPIIEGRNYQFTPSNEMQAKYWTWKYPTVALIPLMKLVSYVTELPLHKITTPTLVLYSPEDKIVDVAQIKQVYQQLGTQHKKIIAMDGAKSSQHHVIAGDILSPDTTDKVQTEILSFLESLPGL